MLHGNASRTLCHFDQTEIACDGELIISAIIFKPLLKTHLQSQIRNCYLGTSERQKHDSDTKLTRTCDQCMTSSDYGGHFYPQLLALPAQYAGAGSIQLSGVRLHVYLSIPSGRCCGGFAAVGPAGRRYRSIAAGTTCIGRMRGVPRYQLTCFCRKF